MTVTRVINTIQCCISLSKVYKNQTSFVARTLHKKHAEASIPMRMDANTIVSDHELSSQLGVIISNSPQNQVLSSFSLAIMLVILL